MKIRKRREEKREEIREKESMKKDETQIIK